jgi:hypothetical protein
MNPLVDYLNSLRTQDGATNPNYVEENRPEYLARVRAAYPWFPSDEDLRVSTRIANLVAAMRRDDFPLDLVFLTGDAGDGKTAACVDLARAEGVDHALRPFDRAGRFAIVKDASENIEEDLLASIAHSRRMREPLLVAINEGRLRRLAHTRELRDAWDDVIEPALEAWIDDAQAEHLDAEMRTRRLGVVNFRHRMHVRTVAPALLKSWTRADYWEGSSACATCPRRDNCPIMANASSLRDERVVQHLTDVLALAHFAGQRLPFRRLQGILAFTITGALGCKDVLTGREPSLADRFYSLLFQRETRGRARPEPAARVLAAADPGLTPEPAIDMRIASWLRDGAVDLPEFERAFLEGRSRGVSVDVFRALRRLTAFQGPMPGRTQRWHTALELLERSTLDGDDKPLLRVVVAALNRLHGHPTTDDEALVAHQIEPGAFRDPARASLELDLGSRFAVGLTRGPVLPTLVRDWLESCPSDVELLAWPAGEPRPDNPARLRLDARLLSLLLEVEAGYRFLPALGRYRRELARFHAHLLSLISVVDPGRVGIVVRSHDRAWRLAGAGDKLRFVGQG